MRSTRFGIAFFACAALLFGAGQVQAASCSSFVIIKSHDAGASTVEIEHTKGKTRKFFPKPEGTPTGPSKIPSKCKRKITKNSTFPVKSSGGRLSMTQIRTNFQGTMLNDADDDSWLGKKLAELIEGKTKVVAVFREGIGKDAPVGITTIYIPITEDEKKEIKRLEEQATDV
jgi:hypothetical protein